MDFYVKIQGLLQCCIFWERSSAEIIVIVWFDGSFILVLVPELPHKLKKLRYKLQQPLEKLYVYIQTLYIPIFFFLFSANSLLWGCSGKYFPLVYSLIYFCKPFLEIRIATQGLGSERNQFVSLGQLDSANAGTTGNAL